MKAILRSPWPLFGIGLGLATLGTAIALSVPGSGRGWLGVVLCVPIFGGLLLVALSPALQKVAGDAEARRRLKGGLRYIVAWLALFSVGPTLSGLLWPHLEPFVGSPGTPLRFVAAALIVLAPGFALPTFLAAPLAEAFRRAAAWLGEA